MDGRRRPFAADAAVGGTILPQDATAACAWCASPFNSRTTGGVPQRFCAPPRRCRHDYRQALIDWAGEQVATGRVTVADLKTALMRKQSTT